jgi:hypothetical protein
MLLFLIALLSATLIAALATYLSLPTTNSSPTKYEREATNNT